MSIEERKRLAAEAAAELVEDGMRVGLGTGSTVAHLLPALARRALQGVRYVATSPETELQARSLGLSVEPFRTLQALDLSVDGADQIAADGWVVKGGGGAHVREKIVAAASSRFVIIADDSKLVERVSPPIPVELLSFGIAATLARLAPARVRSGAPPSPDGHVIADVLGPVDDPAAVSARLDATPGVVGHGLFEPAIISTVLVAGPGGLVPFSPVSEGTGPPG